MSQTFLYDYMKSIGETITDPVVLARASQLFDSYMDELSEKLKESQGNLKVSNVEEALAEMDLYDLMETVVAHRPDGSTDKSKRRKRKKFSESEVQEQESLLAQSKSKVTRGNEV